MSSFINCEFATVNTVTGSTAIQETNGYDKEGSDSLPKIDIEDMANGTSNEQPELKRCSTNKTAFETNKLKNKFEILRQQSNNINRTSTKIDNDIRRTLAWNIEGPSIEVSLSVYSNFIKYISN